MDTEFYNLYVETILKEVGELNKGKMLLQAQIAWQEKKIKELTDNNALIQQANNELNEKVRALSEKKKKASTTIDADPI